jgi:hypothetical protein
MTYSERPMICGLVDPETNVLNGICSLECFAWLSFSGFLDEIPVTLITPPTCAFCYACGRRIGGNYECELHGDEDCPDQNWLYTHTAHQVISLVAGILSRWLSEDELSIIEETINDPRNCDLGAWHLALRAEAKIKSRR